MKIDLKLDGIEDVKRRLGEIADRDLKFAGVQASNTLAFGVRSEWQKTASRVFDRPVRLTIDAAQYRKATLAKPEAEVKLRDFVKKGTPPAEYLMAQVQGGPRMRTNFERDLRNAGILPQGMFAVPAKGFPLDAFGNVPNGLKTRILSYLRANPDAYSNTSKRAKQRARSQRRRTGYFVLTRPQGDLPAGIYERLAVNFSFGATSAIRLVFAFVRQPSYRAMYSVFDVAREYLGRFSEPVLAKAIEDAVASTRARQAGQP